MASLPAVPPVGSHKDDESEDDNEYATLLTQFRQQTAAASAKTGSVSVSSRQSAQCITPRSCVSFELRSLPAPVSEGSAMLTHNASTIISAISKGAACVKPEGALDLTLPSCAPAPFPEIDTDQIAQRPVVPVTSCQVCPCPSSAKLMAMQQHWEEEVHRLNEELVSQLDDAILIQQSQDDHIEELSQLVTKLRAELAQQHHDRASEVKAANRQVQRLQSRLLAAEQKCEVLEKEAKRWHQKWDVQSQLLKDYEEKVEALEDSVIRLSDREATLLGDKAALQNESDLRNEQIKALQEELQSAKQSHHQRQAILQHKLDAALAREETLRLAHQECAAEAEELKEVVGSLQRQLAKPIVMPLDSRDNNVNPGRDLGKFISIIPDSAVPVPLTTAIQATSTLQPETVICKGAANTSEATMASRNPSTLSTFASSQSLKIQALCDHANALEQRLLTVQLARRQDEGELARLLEMKGPASRSARARQRRLELEKAMEEAEHEENALRLQLRMMGHR